MFCQYYIKNFNATLAYVKAYQCSYNVANVEAFRILVYPSVREEIQRLKDIKSKSIMLDKNDIVEKYMNIAFSDMTDFVSWGNENGKNYIEFKDSNIVDGGLIKEVKQGKDGISVKLEDRLKALEWLSGYFLMNPLDRHKVDFDKKKLELEEKKINTEDEQNKNLDTIKEFLNSTKINKEELEVLFDEE